MSTDTPTANPQAEANTKPQIHVMNAPVITIRTILVTPDMAKQWLAQNTERNRPLRPERITAYARDMRRGKWQLTGETIKIDVNGELIDGQHRLHAILESGTAAYMAVAFDVQPTVFDVVDSNIVRTMGDRFRGVSERNRNQIASVVRRVICWERHDYVARQVVTHSEQLERFEEDPSGFTAAAAHGVDVGRQRICTPSSGGTAFYLFHVRDGEKALQFFDMLKTGANLPENHPVLTIRNRLTRSYSGRDDKLGPNEQLALMIRGWNAFRQERDISKAVLVKDRSGRISNQNFPMPI